MAAKRQPKNTRLLILSGVLALIMTGGIVILNGISAPISGAIRIAALLGYLGIFLTSLSSNYARELTRRFGRQFIQVHHYVATTSLVALTLHALLVSLRVGSYAVFVPQVSSGLAFLSMAVTQKQKREVHLFWMYPLDCFPQPGIWTKKLFQVSRYLNCQEETLGF